MNTERPVPSISVGYVLVVEDDYGLARVLRDLLEGEGHIVEHAADGLAGLARIQVGGLDLVLLDLNLPGLHGLDLCRQVRSATVTDEVHLPLLLLSGSPRAADRVAGFAAGADDYLAKPFDADELLSRVRVWLRVRQQMEANQTQLRAQYDALA